MPMKLYEVELKRVSYVTYVVEALDEGDAEDEAWKLLEKDGSLVCNTIIIEWGCCDNYVKKQ